MLYEVITLVHLPLYAMYIVTAAIRLSSISYRSDQQEFLAKKFYGFHPFMKVHKVIKKATELSITLLWRFMDSAAAYCL